MKKIISIIAVASAFACLASAQTTYDALTFSRSNYYGTARTLGMGNAVTAVGGDLGTIAINPAGGAVSGFSQFSFSTGFSTSSSESSYSPSYKISDGPEFSGSFEDSKTRMTVPNVGLNLVFDGAADGIVRWNFGFLINRSQTFTNIISAVGAENISSITGAFATAAAGMPGTILADNSMWDRGYGWNPLAAYDGGLINYNSAYNCYYGSAEVQTGTQFDAALGKDMPVYGVKGVLNQRIGTTTLGSRNDLIFNYGVDINDRLFLGASFAIPIANYRYSEYFGETAASSAEFPVTPEFWRNYTYVTGTATEYVGSTYEYTYKSDISGVNAKIGVIWLPTDGLRLGAAFQTPTAYTINERWYLDVRSTFANSEYNASSGSPVAEASYNFRSPYSANFGVAYTFGRIGMLSVDYELTDFSIMKFSEIADEEYGYSYDDPFRRVNSINKLFCGVSHSLRVGAEVRPLPFLSLRAGFNLVTDPERTYLDNEGYVVNASEYDTYFDQFENGSYRLDRASKEYVGKKAVSVSLGAGYSSGGSFFADVALRRTTLPETEYSPYASYLGGYASPALRSNSSLFDAVLTLGWRF